MIAPLRLFDCAISEHDVDLSVCVCRLVLCAAVIHQSVLKMIDLVFIYYIWYWY